MSDMYVVEMEAESGYRYWSKPMPHGEVAAYVENMESYGDALSDIDIAADSYFVLTNMEATNV